MDRMTDERLAELRYFQGRGYPLTEAGEAEILDALTAERAEVERLKARVASLKAMHDDAHARNLEKLEMLKSMDTALTAERAEVERLRAELAALETGCQDHGCLVCKPAGQGTNGGCRCSPSKLRLRIRRLEAEVERMRRRLDVLDRQEWYKCSLSVAGSSDGWIIEVPETDDAAADLRTLLGMEEGS